MKMDTDLSGISGIAKCGRPSVARQMLPYECDPANVARRMWPRIVPLMLVRFVVRISFALYFHA